MTELMMQIGGLIAHAGAMVFVLVVVLSKFTSIAAEAARDAWDTVKIEWGSYLGDK